VIISFQRPKFIKVYTLRNFVIEYGVSCMVFLSPALKPPDVSGGADLLRYKAALLRDITKGTICMKFVLYNATGKCAAAKSRVNFANLSLAKTVSQLKICDFLGETFKGFELLQFSLRATTTQLLSSGEFCKLRYNTIPFKCASANVFFYTNKSKMPNF